MIFSPHDMTKPVAISKGSRSTSHLLATLKPHREAYRLKLEYDSLDQNDPCPTFSFRIVSKPAQDVITEDVACEGNPLPPTSLTIDTDDFAHSGYYAFPSDFLEASKKKSGSLYYDIILRFGNPDPKAEYYLDVETRSDFLASGLSFQLLYEDSHKNLQALGKSLVLDSGAKSKTLV